MAAHVLNLPDHLKKDLVLQGNTTNRRVFARNQPKVGHFYER